MKNDLKYRSTLYSNYFTNQAGRSFTTSYENKFKKEKEQFLKEIIPLLPNDKSIRILDIGCGIGSLISTLKEQNYSEVKGIDISSEQVKIAHTLGVDEVECMDIADFFSKDTQPFDLICGMDIIEHFSKDELVDLLILIKSKLNKNGKVLFRTPNADAPYASLYAQGDFTHENFMNSNSAKQVMMATGFQDNKILSCFISTEGFVKETIRKVLWQLVCFKIRLIIYASGRSSKEVILTPNMIIMGTKK